MLSAARLLYIILPRMAQGHIQSGWNSTICKTQPQRIMELKSKKCHGVKGYKDKVMVLLSCNADGNRKIHPLTLRSSKTTHHERSVTLLKWLQTMQRRTGHWNIAVRRLDSFKKKTACQNTHVLLLMDECAAYNRGITVTTCACWSYHETPPVTGTHWMRRSHRV
jgi:hypothetical protein